MALNNAAVITGGTLGVTGGTALTFGVLKSTNNGLTLHVPADTDFRLRRTIECEVIPPRVSASAPNGMTQAKVRARFNYPILLANGKYTTISGEVKLSFDTEASATQKKVVKDVVAQILSDSDFTDFCDSQSLY